MSLAFAEHDVAVWQGDALGQLTLMPAGSVQCALSSPPYFGLRDYGTGRWEGGTDDCDHSAARLQNEISGKSGLGGGKGAVGRGTRNVCGKCGALRVDEQLGLESSPAEYVARMVAVFAEVRRVLAANGVLWLNLGDSYSASTRSDNRTSTERSSKSTLGPKRDGPGGQNAAHTAVSFTPRHTLMDVPAKNLLGMPWRVAFALQDDGWILRNAVVWHKPNAMPESVTDRLSTRYELVFLFSKSRRYWFDLDPIRDGYAPSSVDRAGLDRKINAKYEAAIASGMCGPPRKSGYGVGPGVNPGDVWTIPTSPFPGAHFACMPPALAERCIKAGCTPGGTVLDPFAGSGTTLAAARKLGRKSVGIELNPDYIDLIRARIGQAPLEFADDAAPVITELGAVQDLLDIGDVAP